jgi:hypothetical protein
MRTITISAMAPDEAGKLLKTDRDLWQFWSKVQVGAEDECWPYTGCKINTGYGQHRVGVSKVLAHRVAYADVKGPVPDGLVVRHSCHCRPCCNPKHLAPGTQQQNIQEAFAAGRLTPLDAAAGGRASGVKRRMRRALQE